MDNSEIDKPSSSSKPSADFLRGQVGETAPSKRFAKFGLIDNPFIPNPLADYAARQMDARRGKIFCVEAHEAVINEIEKKWVGYPNFEDKLRIGFLWAESGELTDKGMGKSMVIFHIIDKINNGHGSNYFNDMKLCAIYVYAGTGWNKLGHICIEAMRRMEQEGLVNEVLKVLRYESLKELSPSIVSSFSSEADLEKLMDTVWLSNNSIDLAALNEKVAAKLMGFGIDLNLAQAVSEGRFLDYLKSFRSDRQLTLPPAPYDWRLTKMSIRLFFDQCMRILRAGRFSHCYLFVDDIENIVRILEKTPRDLWEFVRVLGGHLFRDDVFSNTSNMLSVFLTTHAKAGNSLSGPWRDAGYDSFAKLHTHSPNSVMISRLTEKGAIAMIRTYLKYFRLPDHSGDDLFPFDAEAVKLLADRSKYHPRQLISNAFHITVKAANEDKVDKIDSAFVNSFFEEAIKIEESEEEAKLEELGFER